MRLLLGVAVLCGSACMTAPTVRPLPQGKSQTSVTLGGPMVGVPNGPTIPLPNITVEYRKGQTKLWDWHAGTHVLPMLFGALGVHAGGTYLLREQRGGQPTLAITERLYLFSNHLDGRKPDASKALWAVNELTLTASWKRGSQTFFVALKDHLDFSMPGLLLTPTAGVEKALGAWRLFAEFGWYAPHASNGKAVLNWYGVNDLGALGLGFGVGRQFGGSR